MTGQLTGLISVGVTVKISSNVFHTIILQPDASKYFPLTHIVNSQQQGVIPFCIHRANSFILGAGRAVRSIQKTASDDHCPTVWPIVPNQITTPTHQKDEGVKHPEKKYKGSFVNF